jgi:hypothetical protein
VTAAVKRRPQPPRSREWWRLMGMAREADKRCRWHARLPGTRRAQRAGTDWRTNKRPKTNGWPKEPKFTGFRPSVRQWLVLFCLAESGRLQVSVNTVPGATVASRTVEALVARGLVAAGPARSGVEAETASRFAWLTDEGKVRVGRRW